MVLATFSSWFIADGSWQHQEGVKVQKLTK